ncbi:hypothetical protein, unlikely [Trypanosoma brucei brucei TREU927]|uniref:Uncharacterized protein n=1 Tax=Trypanosoma brucei brucei (strain 927/4 GUTat10.1) TaxID=185431 RepID=Q38EE6_TRYB2|nr:hypothetical protein, unlikely [Trypanosoma brucei brucei TREU927]EAN76824.1 hypothetical protein, unlikely [Trypanosoma brucei brucei TREU927]
MISVAYCKKKKKQNRAPPVELRYFLLPVIHLPSHFFFFFTFHLKFFLSLSFFLFFFFFFPPPGFFCSHPSIFRISVHVTQVFVFNSFQCTTMCCRCIIDVITFTILIHFFTMNTAIFNFCLFFFLCPLHLLI